MSATTEQPRFLSVSETAARLGVSGQTIRRWVRDGRLHAVQIAPRGVLRVPETELDRLEREGRL